MMFTCNQCSKIYPTRKNLNRHRKEKHEQPGGFKCIQCGKTFNKKWNLDLHTKNHSKRPKLKTDQYQCAHCEKVFQQRRSLRDHIRIHTEERSKLEAEQYQCAHCEKVFHKRRSLRDHIRIHNEEYLCSKCGKKFNKNQNLRQHERMGCSTLRDDADLSFRPATIIRQQDDNYINPQPLPGTSTDQPGPSTVTITHQDNHNISSTDSEMNDSDDDVTSKFVHTETGLKNRLKTYVLRKRPSKTINIPQFFVWACDSIVNILNKSLEEYKAIKFNTFIECEFTDLKGHSCNRSFKTKNVPYLYTSEPYQICDDMFEKLMLEKERCELAGSGFTFLRILRYEIRINKYNPLRGSSHIHIPVGLENTKGLVNVQNNDEYCFKYAVLAKHVDFKPTRTTHYTPEIMGMYNWSGIQFPIDIRDVSIFEKNNVDKQISVNVYGLDQTLEGKDTNGKPIFKHTLYPLKVCERELAEHRDLLYITNTNTGHYVWIKDFERVISRQLTKHDGAIHICKKCFAFFDNQPNKLKLSGAERLYEHKKYCHSSNPLRMDLAPNPKIYFQNHERSQRARFCVYADFECVLSPVPVPDPDQPQPNTIITQAHIPYSYVYLVKDTQDQFNITRTYRGNDAAYHFMQSVKDDMLHIADILYANRQMHPTLTPDETDDFNRATLCYLCGKQFTVDDVKVRDHNHAAPYAFRGAAHRSCNLRHQEQDIVNCYIHNLSNYDAHFIVRELGLDQGSIDVVANTQEKYISFSKRFKYSDAKHGMIKLRFVDTFRFMSSSLAQLVKNIPKNLLKETRKAFPDPDKFKLLCRKGEFPYDHVHSLDVLNETQLPPRDAFYNKLTREHISDSNYDHAQKVWDTFFIHTLGEYSDLYNLTDVLLLADCFENFRDMCLCQYNLDPAHYLTLPSYAWDAMLKMTRVELDTLQDFDQYLFFEKGIRGGITQSCVRHAQANHKYLHHHDMSKPSRYIMYLDANNLYGWSMSQPLPTGNFQWLSREEIDNLDVENLNVDCNIGYVFEVDLTYPLSLHDHHKSLPFCCENKKPPNGKFSKLLTTLEDKNNYITHGRNLKQAVNNGLKISRIHRVLSFDQSLWLKSYIDHNTELRKLACNEFEKDLFKLMNNAVFGKSMENVRKYVDIRLVSDPVRFEKLVARSTFLDRTHYNEDLALVHLEKVRIILDKPIYVGMCILDLSKLLMYDFHYKMLDRYKDKIELCYMDTDSFIYSIQTNDIYSDMKSHLDDFDTSEYPPTHCCFSLTNAKTIGKMKDEAKGKIIEEYIGLMAKLYCIVTKLENGECHVTKKAKGVSRGVVHHDIDLQDYRKCLLEGMAMFTKNRRIQSFDHHVKTVEIHKKSLSPHDDKRFIMEDGIHTLPWGHYAIPSRNE